MTTSTTLWDPGPSRRHANYPIHAADTVCCPAHIPQAQLPTASLIVHVGYSTVAWQKRSRRVYFLFGLLLLDTILTMYIMYIIMLRTFFFVNQLFISVDNTCTEQCTIGQNKLTLGLKVPTVYWKVEKGLGNYFIISVKAQFGQLSTVKLHSTQLNWWSTSPTKLNCMQRWVRN